MLMHRHRCRIGLPAGLDLERCAQAREQLMQLGHRSSPDFSGTSERLALHQASFA
jgi:hypothetical protein